MYHNPGLIKTHIANGAIAARRIVCLEAAGVVAQAASASGINIGVTELACSGGDSVDIIITGIAEIDAGGDIALGALVTSDSNGRAVTAQYPNNILGIALNAAAAGEIVAVRIAPSLNNIDLSGYATNGALADYVKSSALTSTLSNYVTSSALSGALADYATNSALSDYVTSSALSDSLSSYATKAELSGYVTKNSSYIAIPFVAGESIAANKIVAMSNSKVYAAGSNEPLIGVSVEPAASGETILVAVSGVYDVWMRRASNLSKGEYIGTSSQTGAKGTATVLYVNGYYVGYAAETVDNSNGANNAVKIPVIISPGRAPNSDTVAQQTWTKQSFAN